MEENNKLDINSLAVQSHLTIYQNLIQRMASNSVSSKAWCITLVSPILVIVADKSNSQYAMIAYIPTLLFLVLDAYYLGLEKGFRNSYNKFIENLNKDKIEAKELFTILPKGNMYTLFFKSLISFSVWPFYLTLIIMIYITKLIIF
ncbi:MAG: hypothetical protein IPH17_07930 [Bacteroidales bacterium]|nr:hypothetical protein [Bacteroidales bacterium]